jgi:dTDP-L-rhamnose 4-epimerase
MHAFVTGGMGFIGQKLCRRLLSEGHAVTIFDNLLPQVHGDLPTTEVPDGAQFIRGDVRDLGDHAETIDGTDVVFHLAAETGTAQSMYRIRAYVETNEMGTAALLEAIARCERRPRKIVLASSRSVYGEGAYRDVDGNIVQPPSRTKEQLEAEQWELMRADGSPLEPIATPEDLTFAPGSVYAATKASQELLLRSACEALSIGGTILRFQNVYGEGQSLQNPYTGIISIFFNRARQGLEIPIYEDGKETRDFVHVDDVVDALIAAAQTDLPAGTVCNVGSGVATSVAELAATLLGAAGCDVPVRVTGQFRVGDIRHNFADIGQASRLLGFSPRVGLDAGLRRFCAWAQSQPAYADRLDEATAELRKKGLAR